MICEIVTWAADSNTLDVPFTEQERAERGRSEETDETRKVQARSNGHPAVVTSLQRSPAEASVYTSFCGVPPDNFFPQLAARFREPVVAPHAHAAIYDARKSGQEVRIRWSSRRSRKVFTLHESDARGSRFRHYNHDVEPM